MYLSRVEISWGSAKNPYNLHRAIWHLFPGIQRESRSTSGEDRQGFLFRVEKNDPGHAAIVMVQSRHQPQKISEHARIVALKEFNPQPSQGQHLGFILVANPVRTLKDNAGRLNKNGEVKKCRVPLIKKDQQLQWLKERLKGVATLDDVNLGKLSPIFFFKQKEKHVGKLVPVLFEGSLHVEIVEDMVKVLENGIGPGKAFGCGLMLVKRI